MIAPRILFLIVIVLVFFMIAQGFDQDVCEGHQYCISVFATKEKLVAKGKYRYKIGASNRCVCAFRDIHIRWDNFDPLIPLDALTIRKDGDTYLIKDGDPMSKDQFFIFHYIGPQPPESTPGFSVARAIKV